MSLLLKEELLQVVKLCDLQTENDTVTSVQWTDKGDALAVGTNKGNLQVGSCLVFSLPFQREDTVLAFCNKAKKQERSFQIWDVHTQKKVHELTGHTSRIGCLAWNGDLICSGSRDRYILQRDIRQPNIERRLSYHRQEVRFLSFYSFLLSFHVRFQSNTKFFLGVWTEMVARPSMPRFGWQRQSAPRLESSKE